MKYFLRISIILFVLFSIITGCSSSTSTQEKSKSKANEERKEKVLNVAVDSNPGVFDPHKAGSNSELLVSYPIHNSLLRFKISSIDIEDIEGSLAEDWKISDDGLTWTFKLRKGVKWHHGYGEMTSKDVKWSIERIKNPETGSPSRENFKQVDNIETPDPHTVIFHLKQPDPTLLQNLCFASILNEKAVKDAEESGEIRPIGTGPFMFEEFRQNEKVVLVKNKDYFLGEPKLDKVEIYFISDLSSIEIAMKNGEIHMAPALYEKQWLDKMKKNKDIILDISQNGVFWGLYLNTSFDIYKNINLRKAIAHAIDIEKYAKSRPYTAKVPKSVINSSIRGSFDARYDYDPEKAKKYLKEAGYPNGVKLPEMTIPNITAVQMGSEFIQEELRQVGIELPLKTVDAASMREIVYSNQNPSNVVGLAGLGEAIIPFRSMFYGPSSIGKPTAIYNVTHFNEADELIEKAETEINREKLDDLYKQIVEKIHDAYVVVPYVEGLTPLVRSKKVDLGYDFKNTMIYHYYITENTDLKE